MSRQVYPDLICAASAWTCSEELVTGEAKPKWSCSEVHTEEEEEDEAVRRYGGTLKKVQWGLGIPRLSVPSMPAMPAVPSSCLAVTACHSPHSYPLTCLLLLSPVSSPALPLPASVTCLSDSEVGWHLRQLNTSGSPLRWYGHIPRNDLAYVQRRELDGG